MSGERYLLDPCVECFGEVWAREAIGGRNRSLGWQTLCSRCLAKGPLKETEEECVKHFLGSQHRNMAARIAELEGLLRRTIEWVASENSQEARSFATELRAALPPQEEASNGN